jgi:hypothetical protein
VTSDSTDENLAFLDSRRQAGKISRDKFSSSLGVRKACTTINSPGIDYFVHARRTNAGERVSVNYALFRAETHLSCCGTIRATMLAC